jgi:hypothetical protein
MLENDLRERSLKELLSLLATSQRNLDFSRQNREGAHVIQHNKNQIEMIQKAINDKRLKEG